MATQNGKSCEHITMLKQDVKRINAEFVPTRALSRSFRSVQTLCNLVCRASSLFDVKVKN